MVVEIGFRDIYLQAEMYRQGLTVEKDLDKAWNYYCDIAENPDPSRVNDDYYWRGCYRLGMELYSRAESLSSIKEAFRLMTVAKELYDKTRRSFWRRGNSRLMRLPGSSGCLPIWWEIWKNPVSPTLSSSPWNL